MLLSIYLYLFEVCKDRQSIVRTVNYLLCYVMPGVRHWQWILRMKRVKNVRTERCPVRRSWPSFLPWQTVSAYLRKRCSKWPLYVRFSGYRLCFSPVSLAILSQSISIYFNAKLAGQLENKVELFLSLSLVSFRGIQRWIDSRLVHMYDDRTELRGTRQIITNFSSCVCLRQTRCNFFSRLLQILLL